MKNDKIIWVFLLIIMLSSSMTAFMTRKEQKHNTELIIQFGSYGVQKHELSITDNTSLIEAVSEYYYVKLDNGSIDCLNDYCANKSKWLAYNEYGYPIPHNQVLNKDTRYYLILNDTSENNVTNTVMNLLNLN